MDSRTPRLSASASDSVPVLDGCPLLLCSVSVPCCCHRVPPSDPIFGSYMSEPCTPAASNITAEDVSSPKGTSVKAFAAAPQPLTPPPGGWGMCSGTCQAGTCTLDCAKPKCCSPLNPGLKVTPHTGGSQASHDDIPKHSGMPGSGAGVAGVTDPSLTAAGATELAGADDELAPGVPFPVGAVVVPPVAAGGSDTAGGMRDEGLPVPADEPQPEGLLCWGQGA